MRLLHSWLEGWFYKPAVILRLNVGSQEILGPVYDYCLTVLLYYLFCLKCGFESSISSLTVTSNFIALPDQKEVATCI